jgi:histone H3/H4
MSDKNEVVLVVGSKIKDVVREQDLQSSGELVEAVSKKVREMLEAACQRAKDNGRKTVRNYDL